MDDDSDAYLCGKTDELVLGVFDPKVLTLLLQLQANKSPKK